jgi:TRAP-type C4-dicarboxylate transport system substrate-binding protein
MLSLARLSAMTRVSISHLSKIETGKITPTIPALATIATALDRPMTFFFQTEAEIPRSLATVVPRLGPEGEAVAAFSALVESRSSGRMKLEILSASGLDVLSDVPDTLLTGTVDMFVDGVSFYQHHVEALLPALIPFCFRDTGHYEAFLGGAIFRDRIVGALRNKGVRFLDEGWQWRRLPQVLASKRPIFTSTDLQGARIRIANSPMLHEFWARFGARPVFVPWLEVRQALDDDIIDCVLVSAGLLATGTLGDRLKYATLVDVADAMGATVNIGINEGRYQLLPPAIQNALATAGSEIAQQVSAMMSRSAGELISGAALTDLSVIRVNVRPFHEDALRIMRDLERTWWTAGLLDEIQRIGTSE